MKGGAFRRRFEMAASTEQRATTAPAAVGESTGKRSPPHRPETAIAATRECTFMRIALLNLTEAGTGKSSSDKLLAILSLLKERAGATTVGGPSVGTWIGEISWQSSLKLSKPK